MDARAGKPKRHKKRTRTLATSDSDSDSARAPPASAPAAQSPAVMTDAQVKAAFTTYYTRQATEEFAEDIDRVRGAEDFKDDALALLVVALQQGAGMFSVEEQRRVVQAEKEAAAKG